MYRDKRRRSYTSRSASPQKQTNNRRRGVRPARTKSGNAVGIETLWYCLRCRVHTDTVDIARDVFPTKYGVYRHFHSGRCSVCGRKKATMIPW